MARKPLLWLIPPRIVATSKPLDQIETVRRFRGSCVYRARWDITNGQRPLELHAVGSAIKVLQGLCNRFPRDGYGVTVVHARRVPINGGPNLGLPALGIGLPAASAYGVERDTLAGPTVPDQIVVFCLVRCEEVGSRLEPPVVEPPHRHTATTMKRDALPIPTGPTERVVLFAVAREQVITAPPVVEAPDRVRARAWCCLCGALARPAHLAEAVVLGPARGIEVLSRPSVIEA